MNRRFKHGVAVAGVVGALGVMGAGCLTRPVVSRDPVTKTNFTTVIQNTAVDKLDLLFMIDNSASMGDKQALLAQAVPDMINRLVQPNCVDTNNNINGRAMPDGTGCPNGFKPEFPPVHDMHIGVISSSLGGRGGDQCPAAGLNPANMALNAHNDDRAELLNRGGVAGDPTVENMVADATNPDNFSWFPPVVGNNGKAAPPTTALTMAGAAGQAGTLIGDFTQLIEGVHEHGCGFEAQNEAWYRFLIQPDPFDAITIPQGTTRAQVSGIDTIILKQRADFLRKDSLVAVIVVTDENEEAADPLSIGGQGWAFDNFSFPGGPGTAPEGTIECTKLDPNNPTTTGPNDPNCTSCAFLSTGDPAFSTRCPPDGQGGANGYLGSANDAINVRFFNQRERFGLFAGYPTDRYVRGLTKATVPDTLHEHDKNNGNYIGDQDVNANCVNPLFAQDLPTDPTKQDPCALTRGPRTPDLVYYAAIAGVPHQLLQAAPGDKDCAAGTNPADCPQKSTLTTTDWTKIQGGQDPEHYDFRGADFHMIESTDSRDMTAPAPNSPGAWANTSQCPPTSPNNCDPINGREWATKKLDLQFSCIFDLRPQFNGMGKDCTDPKYKSACDCEPTSYNAGTQLCSTQTPTLQIFGKAYPSIREMLIAHAMSQQNAQAGGQGIVSSLCPIHVTEQGQGDPLYGYRPAVNAIVDRLKTALSAQCLPQQLTPNACGDVPCLILVSYKTMAMPGQTTLCKNPGAACDPKVGLSVPSDPDVAAKFCDAQEADWKATGGPSSVNPDPYTVPLCELNQLYQVPAGAANCGGVASAPAGTFDANGSCSGSSTPGWCYVQGAAAGGCGHSILFTNNEPPNGATVSLQCVEQAVTAIGK